MLWPTYFVRTIQAEMCLSLNSASYMKLFSSPSENYFFPSLPIPVPLLPPPLSPLFLLFLFLLFPLLFLLLFFLFLFLLFPLLFLLLFLLFLLFLFPLLLLLIFMIIILRLSVCRPHFALLIEINITVFFLNFSPEYGAV